MAAGSGRATSVARLDLAATAVMLREQLAQKTRLLAARIANRLANRGGFAADRLTSWLALLGEEALEAALLRARIADRLTNGFANRLTSVASWLALLGEETLEAALLRTRIADRFAHGLTDRLASGLAATSVALGEKLREQARLRRTRITTLGRTWITAATASLNPRDVDSAGKDGQGGTKGQTLHETLSF